LFHLFTEILNTSTVEERTAVQEAVDAINDQLIANHSSFTLQIQNTSQHSDLYKHCKYVYGIFVALFMVVLPQRVGDMQAVQLITKNDIEKGKKREVLKGIEPATHTIQSNLLVSMVLFQPLLSSAATSSPY
jgi:hypothetical protein